MGLAGRFARDDGAWLYVGASRRLLARVRSRGLECECCDVCVFAVEGWIVGRRVWLYVRARVRARRGLGVVGLAVSR